MNSERGLVEVFVCILNTGTQIANLLFLGGGSRGPLRKFKEDLELLVKGNKFHRDIIHPNEIDFPFPLNCMR